MNRTRFNCLLVILALAIIDFGPVSLICLIGMYIVMRRPRWFYETVHKLYLDNSAGPAVWPPQQRQSDLATSSTRIRCFLSLVLLMVLDIAPVPVAGSIGLYVIIMRPHWFKALVANIYGEAGE